MEAYVRVKKDRSDEEIKENEVCDCLSSRGRTLIESPGTAQQGVTPNSSKETARLSASPNPGSFHVASGPFSIRRPQMTSIRCSCCSATATSSCHILVCRGMLVLFCRFASPQ